MKNNEDLTIGIIGGAGFIGSYLVKRLKKAGYKLIVGDIKSGEVAGIPITKIDACDVNSLSNLGKVDCIINLAAVHRDDVRPITKYEEINVGGASAICRYAEIAGISNIIFTSSVAIYGFAPPETKEDGEPNYFNEYGKTKFSAEKVHREWQQKDPKSRSLVIVRPTVVFGPGNRGNVYNLLNQIALKRFVMFGSGKNRKSMAYVENVVAFLEYSLSFEPGLHIYNYVDKPDYDMNSLVTESRKILFNKMNVGLRLPYVLGMAIGYLADFIAKVTGKKLPVSSIRVKKFLGTTQFATSIDNTGFIPPVTLNEGLFRTISYEFIEDNSDKQTFETE